MVISFRGTQPDNMWDWLTDAMLILQQTTKDPITGGLCIMKDIGKDAMADGGKTVHRGFYVGYRCAHKPPLLVCHRNWSAGLTPQETASCEQLQILPTWSVRTDAMPP